MSRGVLALIAAVRAEAEDAGIRRAQAQSTGTVVRTLSADRDEITVTILPTVDDPRRPFAPSREPCPRCAARGDLGCAHQRPWVAENRSTGGQA
jgi:hypothetical protein